MYAVIFTYSFDDDVSGDLFDKYDDAVKYLRESILSFRTSMMSRGSISRLQEGLRNSIPMGL